MSALGDYYRAMSAEKIAGIGFQDQQRLTSQAQQKSIEANTNEVGANAFAQRQVLGAQAQEGVARAGQINATTGTIADSAYADQRRNLGAANLANASALGLTAKLPGEIASTAASTAATQAGTLGQLDRNSLILPEGNAQIGATNAQTAGTLFQNRLNNLQVPGSAFGFDPTKLPGLQFYAKGTSKVTKKATKPHATDTVPAMLSPGEAVLNRGAAEHMGRGVIDHMNKLGLMRMAAQHEVSKHTEALAKSEGPLKGTHVGKVMHFLTGTNDVNAAPGIAAMLPQLAAAMGGGQGGAQPAGGGDLASLLGGGGAAPAPAAPAPRKPRGKGKGVRHYAEGTANVAPYGKLTDIAAPFMAAAAAGGQQALGFVPVPYNDADFVRSKIIGAMMATPAPQQVSLAPASPGQLDAIVRGDALARGEAMGQLYDTSQTARRALVR